MPFDAPLGCRRDELDRFVSCHRRHVVRRDRLLAFGDVARTEYGLCHTGVASGGLFGVGHRFVSLFFGEARTVGHEVMVHETARETCCGVADVELYVVGEIQSFEVVDAGQNDLFLFGVVAAKEIPIGFRSLLVERVAAFGDEGRCGVGGQLQILVGIGQIPVFAPRAFVEGDTRFESQGRPTGYAGDILFAGQHFDCVFEVVHHVIHDDAAIFAGLFQQLLLFGADDLLVPGYVAVAEYLLVVEIGAEEVGHAVVLGADGFVGAVMRIRQIVVDFAQGGPGPTFFVGGHAGSRYYVAHALVDHIVGIEAGGVVG